MGLKFTRLVDKDVIPTKVSQLENDSNYQNEEQVDAKVNAITKEKLGLDKVDNTSDMDKPISTLTQKALDLKANSSDVYDKLSVENKLAQKEDKSNLKALAYKDQLNKADVGLSNVDNTSDSDKPISNATKIALDLKANKNEIPTKTSQLTNDSNFLTEHQSLANYYNKDEVDTKVNAKEDKANLKALAYKDSLSKNDVGLENVNNVAITQEEVTQIGTNKTNIENTNKQVETNIQHISNAQSTANEALSIAKGRAKTKVFDTFGDMTNYLKSASKEEFKLGDNLLIKATNVPDYWISNILDNNSGVYGYYEISILETQKVDLSNYYNKSEIDTKETNINNKINEKANASDVYDKNTIDTKEQALNDKIDTKADKSELDNKVDNETFNNVLENAGQVLEETLKGVGKSIEKIDMQINAKKGGDAIPNSGYVDTVYFNTSLSTEQILDIIALDKLDYVPYAELENETMYVYGVVGSVPTSTNESEYDKGIIIGIYAKDGVINSVGIITQEKVENAENYKEQIIWSYENGVGMFDPLGEGVKNYFAIKSQVINSASGLTIGTSNDKLINLMSVGNAETYKKSFYDEMNELHDYVGIKPKDGAIAVPNSGYVENIYFNTSLSIEEVVDIFNNVTLDYVYFGFYILLLKNNNNDGIFVLRNPDNGNLLIQYSASENSIAIFNAVANDLCDFVGWNKDFNGVFEVNSIVVNNFAVSSSDIFSVGIGTEQLTQLVSLNNKFGIVEKEQTLTERVEKLEEVIGEYDINGATTIPTSGYVENVYINKDLSFEEIYNILSSLTYSDYSSFGIPLPAYVVFASMDTQTACLIMKSGDETFDGYNVAIIPDFFNVLQNGNVTYSTYSYLLLFKRENSFEGAFLENTDPKYNGTSYNLDGFILQSFEGLKLGIENEKLKDFLSSTSFEKKPTIAKRVLDIEKELNGDESESEPTTIPSSGTIQNIYFNTNLNSDEVLNIINKLNYIDVSSLGFEGYEAVFVYSDVSMNYALGAVRNGEDYYISLITNQSEVTDFWSYGFGWRSALVNPLPINKETALSDLAPIVGQEIQNEALKNLFSITPFGQKGLIERVSELEKNGGGNVELPTNPEFDSVILKNEDEGFTTEITPYAIQNSNGDIMIDMNAEEGLFSIYNNSENFNTYYGNGSIACNNDNEYLLYKFPKQSGTFVVANEDGTIELKDQEYENSYAYLNGSYLSCVRNNDENSQYWNNGLNHNEMFVSYYDDNRDISITLNAEYEYIGITDNNNGIETYYKNGKMVYLGNEINLPEKSGTLATLDDIQEGGTKIQILTWEDDD